MSVNLSVPVSSDNQRCVSCFKILNIQVAKPTPRFICGQFGNVVFSIERTDDRLNILLGDGVGTAYLTDLADECVDNGRPRTPEQVWKIMCDATSVLEGGRLRFDWMEARQHIRVPAQALQSSSPEILAAARLQTIMMLLEERAAAKAREEYIAEQINPTTKPGQGAFVHGVSTTRPTAAPPRQPGQGTKIKRQQT